MNWKASLLNVDLNESKLNVREDNDKHFEIVPKLLLERDEVSVETVGGIDKEPSATRVISATTGGPDFELGIALNSDFLVLSSELDTVRHVLNFEGTIDFLLWRRSVILVGLSTSEIVLLNPQTFEITESRKVYPNMQEIPGRFFVDGYIHSNPNPNKIDFVAVGVDGTIYSSRNISLSTGALDFTYDENTSIDIDCATIQGSIQKCLPQGTQVLSAASPGQNFFITSEANGVISVFNSIDLDGPDRYFSSRNIIECLELTGRDIYIQKMVHCEGLLFALLSNGRLEILLDEELIPTGCVQLPMKSCIVQDFQLVVTKLEVKMWVIFSNINENDHFIAILPGPKFKIQFLVRIPTLPDESMESEFKFPNSASCFDEPTTLVEITPNGATKVYEMTEVSTDISLQNLLIKGNFGKAELLARKYTKDLDLVWKAKLKSKYDEMLKSEESSEASFNEIAGTLLLIRDPEFVCDFCTQEGFPRLEWVKELFGIGIKRVAECSGSPSGIYLLQRIKALYTFEQVLSSCEIEKWKKFSNVNTNMFEQSILFLENLEFDKAEIVWLRHCDEFISEVDLQHFVPFFKTLFMNQLNCKSAVSLIRTVFPYAVDKCEAPGTNGSQNTEAKIGALIGLVRAQVRALERDRDWPEGAIVFANVMVSVICEETQNLERERVDTGESRVLRKLKVCHDIKDQLEKIIQSLKELGQLIRSHSIRISFEKYTTSSVMDCINTMLRVLFSEEEVSLFVREFIFPFATRHGLDKDEIYKQHIKVIASDVPYFMTSGSIPFEERIVALVGFIESPRTKLDCILIMAEEWPVPWCSVMDSAVKKCLDMNVHGDPYCLNLQKTVELMRIQVPFRVILQKYRLIASRLTLAFNVKHTIKRILKSKKENCYGDCLELIKHTGKCDASGVKSIKFWHDLTERSLPLEDVLVEGDLSEELVQSFLQRILHQFNMGETLIGHSQELWSRYAACGKILANRIDDQKALEFFKIREIIPNLWRSDIIYSMDFPFSALLLILENEHMEASATIIKSCHNLGRLTYSHFKDMLVTAASFYTQAGMTGSALSKIWDILLHIVGLPGLCHDTRIVPFAGIKVIQHLTRFAPTTSTTNLNALHNFCRLMLNSFEGELIEPVAKLIELILIFQDLREQEIPLEEEFLSIYKEVWQGNWKKTAALLSEMKLLGELLLRFGNADLFLRAFHAVQREYMNQSLHSFGPRKKDLMDGAHKVDFLRKQMMESMSEYQAEETNLRIINLVKSLEETGLSMNAYALRQRNKGKLIGKLVEMNCFMLAAQTALVFESKEQATWSIVLQEFINKGTIAELKNLLESLKRITELWVLPEFATAWLKVSETFPNFKQICPIPLE